MHGTSGSGKSTLARELGRTLGVPVLELDSVYHQAHWTPVDTAIFRARVDEFVGQPSWVCDGNYGVVRDLVFQRATIIVFLDLPRWRVMLRLLRRTLLRLTLRREMWNGNRESWRNFVSRDPERNILLWAWRTHALRREEVPAQVARHATHARLVVLHNQRERRAFVEQFRLS